MPRRQRDLYGGYPVATAYANIGGRARSYKIWLNTNNPTIAFSQDPEYPSIVYAVRTSSLPEYVRQQWGLVISTTPTIDVPKGQGVSPENVGQSPRGSFGDSARLAGGTGAFIPVGDVSAFQENSRKSDDRRRLEAIVSRLGRKE